MVACAIFGCDSGSTPVSRQGVNFYRFPKDKPTLMKWILACRRKDEVKVKSARVCSKHFQESDYKLEYTGIKKDMLRSTPIKCRILRHNAVPTLELPTSKHKADASNVLNKRFGAEHRRWSIKNAVLDGTDHPQKVVKILPADSPIKDIEVVEVKEEQKYAEEAEKIHPFQEHDPLSIKLEPASLQPPSLQEELQPKEKSNQSAVAMVFLPVGRWLPSSQSHPAAVTATIQSQSRENQRVNVKEEIDIKEEDIGYLNTEEVAEYGTEKKTSSMDHM